MNYLAGIDDWKRMFSGIPAFATANAIALAWSPITGTPPAVVRRESGYAVVFDDAQEERAARWIQLQLDREPGPVQVEMGGIARKVILREYGPYIAGIALAGAVLGYFWRGK